MECSPYEIGMAKYGTFMTPNLFGSKFFRGNMVKKHEENPLHFLMGTESLFSGFLLVVSRESWEESVLMEIVTPYSWNLHSQSKISPDLRVLVQSFAIISSLLYCNARKICVVIQWHTLKMYDGNCDRKETFFERCTA